MLRFAIGVLGALAIAHPVAAQVQPFPASFRTQEIETNGVTIHVRAGGKGPAVVLLHGYGETGDTWAPLTAVLAHDHTVVLPDFGGMDQSSCEHYASLCARPGAMHSGFEQFKAFDQDAIDNRAFLTKGMLTMPVLAVGGEKSFGPMMATVMRFAATNVQQAVIPHTGHWLMEENPADTIKLLKDFLQ